MIADILKQKKKELGLTTEDLSRLSGVSVGTINKILNGEIKSPRYDTLTALEKVLMPEKHRPADRSSMLLRDAQPAYGSREKNSYTIEDYYALPNDVRAELIDGELIYMESPSIVHQFLVSKLIMEFGLFITQNAGDCIVFPSMDVQLDCDDKTILQPDISIVCKPELLIRRVIFGAPDMVIEINSPSTKYRDFGKKMRKYEKAGVREYWIIDPIKERIFTYFYQDGAFDIPVIYTFQDKVPVRIYDGRLEIDFSKFKPYLEKFL